ncbi:MAG: hypothetical protein U0586_06150 [Candidatus Brocadiaceae bacterium]
MLSKIRLICLLCSMVFIASCAGSSGYMRSSQTLLNPTQDKALVRFMRPSGFGFAINFNMLDGEKVIGNSVAKSQFDYLAAPGKHLFVATAENKAFLDAELDAGKTYYVITRIYPGVWYARVEFIPVNKGSEFWDKVGEYESTLNKLEPDLTALKAWEEANKPKIQKVLSDYESEWKNKYQWPKLMPEDGR